MTGRVPAAYVVAPDPARRTALLTALRQAGVRTVPDPDGSPGTVVVTAVGRPGEALDLWPAHRRRTRHPMVIVADRFPPADVAGVLRSGILVMLRSTDATGNRLAAALHAARVGEGRVPHDVLVGVLGGGAGAPARHATARTVVRTPLTPRQKSVLALMAEGQDNATIARSLLCSDHTVKNVIYDMMARMQVRNRAHAVAYGVEAGLI